MNKWVLDQSGYKGMWQFVLFDLPVDTKAKRKRYSVFRRNLLQLGFTMLQFSVYARYFPSQDAVKSSHKRIKDLIPQEGEVRLLAVTDKQFGKMEVIVGKKPAKAEKPPEQLLLF